MKHVFGIPGEETLDLNESLAESSIQFVPVRHEQGGAYMADVYGRLTGRAGVCLGTLGPGAMNLVTAVADAFLDLVGYSRADLEAGRIRWSEMTPPEFHAVEARALVEIAKRGVCTPFEKEYVRKDGTRVPILIGGALLRGSRDEGVCFALDISQRRHLEGAYVLRALGRSDEATQASLRLSLGRGTTEEDVDRAAAALVRAVVRLRAALPAGALERIA